MHNSRAKHGKPSNFVIPRGPIINDDVQPMTGCVTTTVEEERMATSRKIEESRQATMSFISRRNAELEQKLDLRTDVIMEHIEGMYREYDKLRRDNKALWSIVVVIIFYLAAWLIGWGFGAW